MSIMFTATYSPDDNKLRLYAATRLDAETYARAKKVGFRWAPKQDLFFATWGPAAEDFVLELAGEVGDDDSSLTDRAEERAERFEGYRENRTADAESAQKAVAAIADGIPFGQPILVGHHSEKHARRDAEKIENGMRRAVKMWDTANYWRGRAAGAIRHAKYKERPDVRARRIKGLEAEQRKVAKSKKQAEAAVKLWGKLHEGGVQKTDGTPSTFLERAIYIAGHTNTTSYGTYSDLTSGKITPEQARDQTIAGNLYSIKHYDRWLTHIANRLEYERAMLGEGTVADQTKPEKGGAVRCWAGPRNGWAYIVKVNKVSVTILRNWGNGGPNFTVTVPLDKLHGVMTAAQVQEARDTGMLAEAERKDVNGTVPGFFLRGEPTKRLGVSVERDAAQGEDTVCPDGPICPDPECREERTKRAAEAMRASLKVGVRVVTAPSLFPTPPTLARRMVELADLQFNDRVLEPSAGTGNLVDAILRRAAASQGIKMLAVEINQSLADDLARFQGNVSCADFLSCRADPPPAGESHALGTKVLGRFDCIVMNPPFDKGADIKHVTHALTFLKPGGRLVALCAHGPRQIEKLKPLADQWIPLGAAFEPATSVGVALMVVNGKEGTDA